MQEAQVTFVKKQQFKINTFQNHKHRFTIMLDQTKMLREPF